MRPLTPYAEYFERLLSLLEYAFENFSDVKWELENEYHEHPQDVTPNNLLRGHDKNAG